MRYPRCSYAQWCIASTLGCGMSTSIATTTWGAQAATRRAASLFRYHRPIHCRCPGLWCRCLADRPTGCIYRLEPRTTTSEITVGRQQCPFSHHALGDIEKPRIENPGDGGTAPACTLAQPIWHSPCATGDVRRYRAFHRHLLQGGKLDLCRQNQRTGKTWAGGQTECAYQRHLALSAMPSVQGTANLLISQSVGWPNVYDNADSSRNQAAY